MNDGWSPVGAIDPKTLAGERLQLHYGAWILGSVAHSLLPHEDDDSHSNLGLTGGARAFATHVLGARRAIVLELDVAALELAFRTDREPLASLSLAGRTMDEALGWANEFAQAECPDRGPVVPREYPDFPDSELVRGGAFQAGDPDARAELGRWFGNAHELIRALVAGEPAASPVRTWPHHFDIGTLIDLGDQKSVGAGLSPGDGNYDEPYLYVYGYPTPDPERLAALTNGAGRWTTRGFTGALLTASELIGCADPQGAAAGFFREAVAHSRAALG